MNRTFLIRLAPLLAIAAFAVMPAATQARGMHYYSNLAKIAEGKRLPVVSWGLLTMDMSDGSFIVCKTTDGGWVENPPGGGPGVGQTVTPTAYSCDPPECPMEERVEAINSAEPKGLDTKNREWKSVLTEAAEQTRSETTGVELVVGCWTASPTGPGNVSTSERGTPISTLLPLQGTLTPKIQNGITAGKPTHIEYGAGSGELIGESGGSATIHGTVSILGYTEQELITTGL